LDDSKGEAKGSPPQQRRGDRDIKKMSRSSFEGAGGVVLVRKYLGQHHPVCAGYGGSAAFLDRGATPSASLDAEEGSCSPLSRSFHETWSSEPDAFGRDEVVKSNPTHPAALEPHGDFRLFSIPSNRGKKP